MSVDRQIGQSGAVNTPQYQQDHQAKVSVYDMDPRVAAAKKSAWDEIAKQILANSQQAYQESSGASAPGSVSYSMGSGGGSGGGGGGRRGGGGGGGGGGASAAYSEAMKAYLASMEAGRAGAMSPYEQATSGINSAYTQAQQQIAAGQAQQAQRLAAAHSLQDQYNQQLHAAYTNPGAQYDFGALMHDLQSQGAGTGGLAAQAALARANSGLDASRRSTLADSLIAGRNFDNAQRGDIAAQLTQGMNGQLDINHLAYLAQIAKQRAAAETAYNQQIAQLKLQMAQNGVAP